MRIVYRYGLKNADKKYPKDGFIRSTDYDVPDGCDLVLVYKKPLTDAEIKKYDLVNMNGRVRALTRLRLGIGMKQTELAAITGLSLRTIQGWELNGMGGAALSKAYKTAKALGCTMDDLLDDDEKE